MRKKLVLISWIIIIATATGAYIFKDDISKFIGSFSSGDTYDVISREINDFKKEIYTSTPLKSLSPVDEGSSTLSSDGIVSETNKQRIEFGLDPLSSNAELRLAAQIKTEEMFKLDYFEHISPSGIGPGGLAEIASYEYLVIGENLAMGFFEGDIGVVEAWMNSPGHRANILNTKYTEIGVYASKGMFDGKEVWIAVQEFGRPLSDCPAADESLKEGIESNREIIDRLTIEIEEKKQEIDDYKPKRGPEYNRMVDEYNELVREYNSLVEETRQDIETYNNQINTFNTCVQG